MRVGALDDFSGAPVDTNFRFDEPGSMLDLDLLIWDTASLAGRYAQQLGTVRQTLSIDDSESLLSLARHWRAEFEAHHARGGTLVVFAAACACVGVHTLQEVVDFDPLELLPGGGVRQIALSAPAAVRSAAGEPFARFFTRNADRFVATSRIETGRGASIFELTREPYGCDAPAGVYCHAHPGRWLVLPTLRPPGNPKRIKVGAGTELLESIVELVARLRGDAYPPSMAAWAVAPLWLEEKEAANAYDRVRAERIALEVRSRDLRKQLESFAWAKQIVAAAPPGNARAAATALSAIDLPTHAWNAAGDILLTQLPDGTVAVGTVVGEQTDPPVSSGLVETAQRNARDFMADAGTPARAWLLYAGDHRIEPSRRPFTPQHLLEKAATMRLGVVTTIQLLDAWREPAARTGLIAALCDSRIVEP